MSVMEETYNAEINLSMRLMRILLDIEEIDITKEDYKGNKNYLSIKNEVWYEGLEETFTVESFIERYMQNEVQVQPVFESIYDMGNHSVDLSTIGLDDTKYRGSSEMHLAFKELSREVYKYLHTEEENEKKKKRMEKKGGKKKEKDEDEFADGFRDKLYKDRGSKNSGGLVKRLKEHMDLDVKKFKVKEGDNKAHLLKVLYFFHMLENREYPDKNVLLLLSEPSMENIDNIFKDWPTTNGLITRYIVTTIAKELTSDKIEEIENILAKIEWDWDCIQRIASIFEETAKEYNFDSRLKNLTEFLASAPQKLDSAYNANKYAYKHTLIETVYLKILQQEARGKIKDLIDVNRIPIKEEHYTIHERYVSKIKSIIWGSIDVSEIEAHIEDHAPEWAEYVYLKEEVTEDEWKKIKDCKGKVRKILSFFDRHTQMYVNTGVPVDDLIIISCLQEIILGDSKETIEYTFSGYGYKSKKKLKVFKALEDDMLPYDALQAYWVRKVMNRWNANLGRLGVKNSVVEFEIVCGSILVKILERPNLDEMKIISDYYIAILKRVFILPEDRPEIIPELERDLFRQEMRYFESAVKNMLSKSEGLSSSILLFKSDLANKGFKLIDTENKIRNVALLFLEVPYLKNQALAPLVELIGKKLADLSDKEIATPIKYEHHNEDLKYKLVLDYEQANCTMADCKETIIPVKYEFPNTDLKFKLVFNYEQATCTQTDFNIKHHEQYIKKLESLGLVIPN